MEFLDEAHRKIEEGSTAEDEHADAAHGLAARKGLLLVAGAVVIAAVLVWALRRKS
jgi:hypothetical protein